jgi:hypothetical protein
VLDYLEDLQVEKFPEKPKKPRKVKGRVFYVNHNYNTRAYVIWLRFGSVTEECDPPLRTFQRIFEITGVKVASCMTIVRNWRRHGHEVVSLRGKWERKLWYTADMKKYLLDPQTLSDWAAYSLPMRVLKIEQMFGVKIHYTTLSLFYRKHRVTCRKPQYTYLRK